MNTTKNTQPAPIAKFWKGYTSPGVYEVTQAVTAGGEWLCERLAEGNWGVGHLPTKTEVRTGFRTLRAARVYAAGDARADFEKLAA